MKTEKYEAMGHELSPRNGQLLPVPEVARRLKKAFPYVVVDEEDGLRFAHASAERLSKLPARVFLGRHDDALARAAKLRDIQTGEALVVVFGKSADENLRIVLLPDEPIRISYGNKQEEQAQRGLVDECAAVLECQVEVF